MAILGKKSQFNVISKFNIFHYWHSFALENKSCISLRKMTTVKMQAIKKNSSGEKTGEFLVSRLSAITGLTGNKFI